MNNLLPSVLLFLIISVIFCDGSDDTWSDDYNYCDGFDDDVDSLPCLDPSPDVIKQCVNDDSCGANNASFVGFYKYVVDDDDDDDDDDDNSSNTTIGVQYAICATNNTGYTMNSGTITHVEANSICKINEVTMALPEDSSEKCSDLLSTEVQNERGEYVKFSSSSDCLDRCNNVIFQDWNDKAYSNELDDDADFGESEAIKSAATGIDGEEVCLCNWGNSTPIVGCVTRHTPASDANSMFITSSFAAGLAVIVASATAIEMAFV